MLVSHAREALVQMAIRKSAEQGQGIDREMAEWLVDGSIRGDFTDKQLASMIGPVAVPAWNRITAKIHEAGG